MLPTAILSVAMMALLLWARRGLWRLAILALPGTFAHEISHLLVGAVLFAKPSAISLIPRHVGNTYILGCVSFRNITLFNGAFVSLAPLLLAPLGYLCLIQGTASFDSGQYEHWALWGVLAGNLFFSALPSIQDIKAGFLSLIAWSAVALIATLLLRGGWP